MLSFGIAFFIFIFMKKKFFYLITVLFFIQACHSHHKQSLPEITLAYTSPVAEPHISELTDHLQIIPLETSDSCLLAQDIQILYSKKYILSVSSEEIHQFSSTGKYIRKLAVHGRAPKEFSRITAVYIDEIKEHFLLADINKRLLRFDLKTGYFITSIPLPFIITKIIRNEQDNLLCEPIISQGDTCPYPLFFLNPQGKIEKGLADTVIGKFLYVQTSYLLPDGNIRLKKDRCDTVFTLDNFHQEPLYIVKSKYTEPAYSANVWLQNESTRHYYFLVFPWKIEYTKENTIKEFTRGEPEMFRVNKQNLNAEIIRKIYIDTLGISLPFENIRINKEKVHFIMTGFRFKESLAPLIEKHQLSPAIEQLYQKTKEEDNPLVFIGNKK